MNKATSQTSSQKLIDRISVNFDRAANYHAYYRLAGNDAKAGEIHIQVTHRQAFEYLSGVEAFLFRIDPHKSLQAQKKIMQKLTSMGFNVQSSTQTHYQYYAFR